MFERFLQARRHERDRSELGLLLKDCRQLLTEQGEANSLAIAARALARYRNLSAASRQQFFEAIASDFDPDPGDVLQLAEKYAVTRSPENLIALTRAAEPPRQELLRRRHQPDRAGLPAAISAGQPKSADEEALRALCACYLLHSTRQAPGEGDPVARFHLANGARLERVNSLADLSRKGVRGSYGLMVNYLYDLDEIENNHQAFVNGRVSASRAVTSLI